MGFGLTKIIFTALVIFLVWKLFTWVRRNRLNQSRRNDNLGGANHGATLEPQDTVQCAVCQAYVPVGAGDCGREDCPYPLS